MINFTHPCDTHDTPYIETSVPCDTLRDCDSNILHNWQRSWARELLRAGFLKRKVAVGGHLLLLKNAGSHVKGGEGGIVFEYALNW